MAPGWTRHLPPGLDWRSVDLTAACSLPSAWARIWSAAPDRPVIHDGVRWTTAGELDERTRRTAPPVRTRRTRGRRPDRGERSRQPGSCGRARRGAARRTRRRTGEQCVPGSRGGTDRARLRTEGCGRRQPSLRRMGRRCQRQRRGDLGPERGRRLEPGDREQHCDPGAHRTRVGREFAVGRRDALLHVGHHRHTQGGTAHPRQHPCQSRSAAHRVALDRRGPHRPRPAPVPCPRPRHRSPRQLARGCVGGPGAAVRARCRVRRRARPPGHDVLRRADDVRPSCRVSPQSRSSHHCGCVSRVPRRCRLRCSRSCATTRASRCSSATG